MSNPISSIADPPLATGIIPLSRVQVLLFAVISGMSVANVYYAQPLLDRLATDFSISLAGIGAVVTATQLGCALALLLLVPLGDRLERRRLMAVQLAGLVLMLMLVALAGSPGMLLLGMLGIGAFGTAMTQGMIAFAASAAAPAQRGAVVGAAQGGVFVGLLLARVFSGAISDLAGWRGVYLLSAVLMLAMAVPLWRRLPVLAVPHDSPSYPRLLLSMLQLLRDHRMLQIRGVLAMLMFAAFNVFWSAVVLPLSAPPYGYSHTAIGALGLVGAVGAMVAARAGYWSDRGWAQYTTAAALVLLLLAWWPLSQLSQSIAVLLLGILILDMGGQALHVTNQSLVFADHRNAHARLVGLYMMFYAVGSGAGAIAGTTVYQHAGWNGVCLLGAAISLLALLFWVCSMRSTALGRGSPGSR